MHPARPGPSLNEGKTSLLSRRYSATLDQNAPAEPGAVEPRASPMPLAVNDEEALQGPAENEPRPSAGLRSQ